MDVYRKEMSEFIRLAETLLSPVSLGEPLTDEECKVVDFYVMALAGNCASQSRTSADQTHMIGELNSKAARPT